MKTINDTTQFFNDVRSKYNLVPTSNPSGFDVQP
jgi:hypothetical protein